MAGLPENVAEWVVLIVDDHVDNLELAEAALMFYGAQVTTATTGQAGLDCLDQVRPNLILLDLSMPVMDGWTLFTRIRERSEWADVPIVALTAHAMVGDRDRVLAAGFDGYIAKPFKVMTFVTDIQKALQSQPRS